jgi:hypothetical protein
MSTPDFDSMSPEELMAWMESLARRQGADEGFTSDTIMDVPEIDPSTVQDTGPGYIPYGMDPEVWAEKQRQEEERKAARRAAQATTTSTSASTVISGAAPSPASETPAPAVSSTPAVSNASAAEPDFDSMSPEELMAWMESLARRQGADEGFTTDKVVDVPEIDPATVQDTGPGYIPYGMDPEVWAEKQRQEEERKAARRAAQSTTGALPTTPPVPSMQEQVSSPLEASEPVQSSLWDEAPQAPVTASTSSAADDPLAWLASLSAGENSTANTFDELDLAALGAPLEAANSQIDDPMAWLESLSQPQASIPGLDQLSLDFGDAITGDAISPAAEPVFEDLDEADEYEDIDFDEVDEAPAASAATTAEAAGANTLEWLESLARTQGVNEDELITEANLDIPMPEVTDRNADTPGYTEYSFETPEDTPGIDPLSFLESFDDDEYDLHYEMDEEEDPDSAWLNTLAAGANASETEATPASSASAESEEAVEAVPDTDEVMAHLARNEVNPDEIESWMSSLLEQGASRTDVADYLDEEGEELVEATLPDWLIEQVGAPPADQSTSTSGASSVQLPENFFDAEPSEEALASLDELDELVALEEAGDSDDLGELGDLEGLSLSDIDQSDMAEETPDLGAEFAEAAALDMPDWLTEDIEEYEAVDFSAIFDDQVDEGQSRTLVEILNQTRDSGEPIDTDELVMSSSDPWIEAFETERRQGLDDITHIPEWYAEKLQQLQGDAVEEGTAAAASMSQPLSVSVILAEANLPDEEELPSGALQSIPDWLRSSLAQPQPLDTPVPTASAPAAQAATTAPVPTGDMPDLGDLSFEEEEALPELSDLPGTSSGELPVWLREQILDEDSAEIEIPDWLREAGITDVTDVPDWLTESITTEEPIVEPIRATTSAPTVIIPAVQQPATPAIPAQQPAAQQPVQTAVSPAYVPVTAASINVQETLTAARTGVREGNVEVALQSYEAVVRSNQSIEDVISDLNSLTRDENYKSNPAVYRVLGDGLMRTGNLQEALNTYRKALNML